MIKRCECGCDRTFEYEHKENDRAVRRYATVDCRRRADRARRAARGEKRKPGKPSAWPEMDKVRRGVYGNLEGKPGIEAVQARIAAAQEREARAAQARSDARRRREES